MKTLITAIMLIALFIPTPSIARELLTLITDPFPPLYYQVDGENKGIYCEILDLTFKEMKIPYTLAFVPWERALRMAETQRSDGIPGTAKTKERDRFLIFPDEPISVIDIVVFHRKDDTFKFDGISSLAGKRIGTIDGYSYGKEFDQSNLFSKEKVSSLKLNFLKLQAKRIDLVIAYKNVALYTLQSLNLTDQFSYSSLPVHRAALYLAFSKKPGYEQLAEEFSQTLRKIKNTEAAQELFKKAELN
ncbi:substrate-binding periplasmic protein [Desulfovibrio gilichinskyi]|uniref:Amino acid ABC transporter substrate-binding protein, PAAT family n=1 Tax=Desulfovibrio gilichinskyi TaxID=1519643 RepID=A0A1X7CXA9_9BACT|nr:transporter substrate-binding domain-containing protein [Desulfovibrio gilichinskyi]SMF04739.1 amino acid ABC transporter substrate-binding protein, PAAT family [Desulfovibrio gilichinskyi]